MLIGFIRLKTGRHCGLFSTWRLTFAFTKGGNIVNSVPWCLNFHKVLVTALTSRNIVTRHSDRDERNIIILASFTAGPINRDKKYV
jgi:hypothetical protein